MGDLREADDVRPMMERLREERVRDSEDDGRRRPTAARVLLELGVVYRKVRPVFSAVAEGSDH